MSLREAKYLLNKIVKHFGFEIRRTEPDLIDYITNRGINIVLDVGANVGQFGELLRLKGYTGKIISFEPVHAVYQTLAAKAAADGDWDANNFALGAKSEQTMINVSQSSVFSSILPATRAAARFDKQAIVASVEEIVVKRLDDLSLDRSSHILLKIDTQGFEKAVLEGGQHLLPTMKGILLELPIVHLYEGTWQFHQAVEYMSQAGFVPAQIHPVNYHSADYTSIVEVDCLFRPRDDGLD